MNGLRETAVGMFSMSIMMSAMIPAWDFQPLTNTEIIINIYKLRWVMITLAKY